ncbi:MAG TPA: thioredoxin fold domain-containing protein [Burkholderiales bacterium]|nr:thioredoxin fold domain-containing protein [Burkholderiales bacterium]
MKGFIAALALALASSVASAQEPPAWFSESLLDLREDVADAAARGKRVMLYFGQDGCPYCKRLMEVNFRQAAIAAKAQRQLVALAINIWGDREVTWTDGSVTTEKRLAAQLKVQFTPTLLFLDERGGVALRLNGYHPPHQFEAALDHVAGKISYREYLEQQRREPASARLHPQPFFLAPPYDLRRRPGAKPLAVLFETPFCAQCDEMHAVAFKRQEVLEQLAGFDVFRLTFSESEALTTPDGRKTSAAAWANALRVGYVPTLLLFDARGREVFRTEAYLRPFHIAGALDYVSSGGYLREPSFQRFLQAKAERMRERGERVDLWD